MNLKAPRGTIWVALGLVLALIMFTTLEVAGVVAPRGFAILCLVAMISEDPAAVYPSPALLMGRSSAPR
jgi:hypothetical protein